MKPTFRLAGPACACALFLLNSPVSHAKSDSSVQIYGIVDAGIQYLSNGPSGQSMTGLSSGNLNGSRWGLKGSEAISDDLKAVFVLESGIDMTNGQLLQGKRQFGRQAYVGLNSKTWGQLALGRHNTLMIDWMSKYAPLGNANIGIKRADPALSDRTDNAIKYTVKLGPVTAGAYYSFGWNNDQDMSDKQKGRMIGVGLKYAAGPVDAAVLFHSKHADAPKTGANSGNREDRIMAGLSYKFSQISLYAGYRWLKQHLTTQDYRSNMYWAGIMYRPTKPVRLSFTAYQINGTVCDDMNNATCPAAQHAGSEQKPTLLVASGEYDLSKRTTLYALGGYAINNHGSSMSLAGGKYGVNVEPGSNQFGMQVGIRHQF